MSYLVLFKFNNAVNARLFAENNPLTIPFQAETVQVPQGYTPTTGTTGQSPGPSTGIGQPSGPPGDTTTFVTIELPSIQTLTTFVNRGYNPLFVFDNQTHSYQFDPNQIDPNTITIQARPGDVKLTPDNLLAPMDNVPPLDQLPMTTTTYPYPVDPNLFPPIFDQPDLRKSIQRGQLDQPIEKQDLPPIPIPEPYVNPYDITDPRNFETIFPEIKRDPNAPIFVNPETDPNLDPNILIQPPRDTVPIEMQDLPQRHLDPKNPTLEPMETPTPISDSGEGGGIAGILSSVFVAGQQAIYGNGAGHPPTANGNLFYANDGINWNQATLTVATLPGLDIQQLFCFQGVFTAQYAFTSTVSPFVQGFGWLISANGISWRSVCQSIGNTINMSYNTATGVFTYTSNAPPQAGLPVSVTNTNPLIPTLPNQDMSPLGGKGMADPGQVIAGSTIPANQTSPLSLPTGITAVRDVPPFQTTATTITNAIVSGGTSWPGAAWVTPPSYSNIVLAINSNDPDIVYAAIIRRLGLSI